MNMFFIFLLVLLEMKHDEWIKKVRINDPD